MIQGEGLSSVTWFITRPDQEEEQLHITGNVSRGTRVVPDLVIRTISAQFEGKYRCGRTFVNQTLNGMVDVACVFVISKLCRLLV